MTNTKNLLLPLLADDGSDFVDLVALLNDAFSKMDNAVADFNWLCQQKGVESSSSSITDPSTGMDTETNIATKSGVEIARAVAVESHEGRIWTTTITIGNNVKVITETEQSDGSWKTEVA